jgi:hypothetical protein
MLMSQNGSGVGPGWTLDKADRWQAVDSASRIITQPEANIENSLLVLPSYRTNKQPIVGGGVDLAGEHADQWPAPCPFSQTIGQEIVNVSELKGRMVANNRSRIDERGLRKEMDFALALQKSSD